MLIHIPRNRGVQAPAQQSRAFAAVRVPPQEELLLERPGRSGSIVSMVFLLKYFLKFKFR